VGICVILWFVKQVRKKALVLHLHFVFNDGEVGAAILGDRFSAWIIGISIIMAYPFLKLRLWNLLPGVLFISLGLYLKNYTFGFSWLMWLGLMPEQIYTVDFFPILPWFGVVIIGLFLGYLIYPDCTRRFNLCDLSNFAVIRLLCLFGRHSLLIYLIHQPILIAVLYLWVL
jgi:uncharacterized membrane protein